MGVYKALPCRSSHLIFLTQCDNHRTTIFKIRGVKQLVFSNSKCSLYMYICIWIYIYMQHVCVYPFSKTLKKIFEVRRNRKGKQEICSLISHPFTPKQALLSVYRVLLVGRTVDGAKWNGRGLQDRAQQGTQVRVNTTKQVLQAGRGMEYLQKS